MGAPHKYADVIKAWADGAAIQSRVNAAMDWKDLRLATDPESGPAFHQGYEYRLKPDPYQHLKDAQAAGKRVQCLAVSCDRWFNDPDPASGWSFTEDPSCYRIVETEEIECSLVGPMGVIEVKVNVEFAGDDVLDVKVTGFEQ